MTRPALEVADVFRRHGDAFLDRYGGGLSREQRRVLRDVTACRTAALGGHVEQCDRCGHRQVAYNSCRNRHCPKCQATAAADWMQAREAELLPAEYFHLVFTLPASLGPIALQDPRLVYGLLFRAARQTAPGGQDIGFVGRIEHVDPDVINHVAADYIPVVASVAADRDGVSHNINADEAAGAVAGALGAYKLMFLTDVEGWLRDPADPTSIVSQASAADVKEALPSVGGGMRPKLQACVDAIAGGVTFSHIVDGRLPHSLLLELFTDAGIGTKISA
jgi:hypothetical protein